MKPDYQTVVKNDIQINVSNKMPLLLGEWFKEDYPEWEENTFKVFEHFLSKEHTCLDIGGWVGATVLYSAQLCKNVIAIEPSPPALELLRANVAVARENSNIEIVPLALSSEAGTALLHSKNLMNSAATLLDTEHTSMDDCVEVPLITVDDLEQKYDLSAVNLIKMDVEGFETVIFPALEALIRKNQATVLMSIHPWLLKEQEVVTLINRCQALYPYLYHIDMKTPFSYPSIFTDEHGGIDLIGSFSPIEHINK